DSVDSTTTPRQPSKRITVASNAANAGFKVVMDSSALSGYLARIGTPQPTAPAGRGVSLRPFESTACGERGPEMLWQAFAAAYDESRAASPLNGRHRSRARLGRDGRAKVGNGSHRRRRLGRQRATGGGQHSENCGSQDLARDVA